MFNSTRLLRWFSLSLIIGCGIVAAGPRQAIENPDFTRGGSPPVTHDHDWNLGPTGLRGWIYSDKLVTTGARQIYITRVEPNSPADNRQFSRPSGVQGKPFANDAREEFGRAITMAESTSGGGTLRLTRWRKGRTEEITLPLSQLGDYSPTAPYQCSKSKLILARGTEALVAAMNQADYTKKENAISRALNALALLAIDKDRHRALLEREAAWAASFTTSSFRTWYYGYLMIFLAEYHLATGDQSVLPGLRRLAMESSVGQSAVGSWGHDFALPGGGLKGYGMMNSPGIPLTLGLALTRDAGIEQPEINRAVARSTRLLGFYVGKGAVPYGDHPAWVETHEDNGKCGMAAVLFHHLGETGASAYFTRMALASHGNERDCGHTGNFFNLTWSLPAIALAGPAATGGWMREFGSWYFDLARRWDGSFAHQGPPEPRPDSYRGFDATGAYLLAYALPLRKTVLTGKRTPLHPPMQPEAVEETLAAGRGWTNKNRHEAYDAMAEKELLAGLASWSPVVRIRAAEAMARRKYLPLENLHTLLQSPRTEERIGACHALEAAKSAALPALPALRERLRDPDLWVRVKAADAIVSLGEHAAPALPELLDMLAREPGTDDPRGMEQRFLVFAVFGKLLKHPTVLDRANPEQIRLAIEKGLRNQDGQARSQTSELYTRLSYEQIEPLLPAILEAVRTPAPSGEMFADGVRLNGLRVLATHHTEEGMEACAVYLRDMNRWASEHRTPNVLEILLGYGGQARQVLPHLRETAARFEAGEPDFPKHLSARKAAAVREAIKSIENSDNLPPRRSLR